MAFNNIQLDFLGSNDFPLEAKCAAAQDLNAALEAGWAGFTIAERVPLENLARAHDLFDHPEHAGRVVVVI